LIEVALPLDAINAASGAHTSTLSTATVRVPIAPTAAMLVASGLETWAEAARIWDAMLAARPQ
jgi:hypothetical protein